MINYIIKSIVFQQQQKIYHVIYESKPTCLQHSVFTVILNGRGGFYMDIGSGSGYPESTLSNFSPHPFVIDGIQCNSMEGFLQSLKFKEPEMQKEICLLIGKAAKFRGKKKKWYRTQTLYWQGTEYKRDSEEYQILLDRAFDCLAENTGFQKALLATGNSTLTHSIGKTKTNETVLTRSEFCSRLTRIRNRLQNTK